MANTWSARAGRILTAAVKAGARSALRNLTKGGGSTPSRTRTTSRSPSGSASSRSAASPRTHASDVEDFPGSPVMEYSPNPDGRPDPGEIIWAWVPYEEDHSKGKDRPALIIGRDGVWLLGLMLTSKDHDRDERQEAQHGRYWTDIGAGDWDAQRRPSEVRVDRVLRIDPSAVRREGSVLDRPRFDQVAREVARVHGVKRR